LLDMLQQAPMVSSDCLLLFLP